MTEIKAILAQVSEIRDHTVPPEVLNKPDA